MAVEIVTKEDLNIFRIELLKEIKQIIPATTSAPAKEWLKANEVRKLLSISPNTLQSLRITGKLHSSKVGGIHYYRFSDIQNMLESCRSNS